MQPNTDSTEWHVANGQRLAAIELQMVKIRELGREAQHRELDDPVRQRELQRLAAIELQSEKTLAAAEQRRVYIEGLRRQAEQTKLDAAAKRLECKRAKDQVRAQQEAFRGEKARLDSLASVEQSRELWRLRDEKSRENKRLPDTYLYFLPFVSWRSLFTTFNNILFADI
jgi:hypothetical protein